jgi:hypothetical protein
VRRLQLRPAPRQGVVVVVGHPVSATGARHRERIAEPLGLRGQSASSAPLRRLRRFRRPL